MKVGLVNMPELIQEENFMLYLEYVVHRKHVPSWRISEQVVPVCDLTYVVGGHVHYTGNGKTYDLAEGDLLYLTSDTVRTAVIFPSNLMECYSVNFCLTNMKGESMVLPFQTVSHIGTRPEIVNLFGRLSTVWLKKQGEYHIEVKGIFLLILHHLFDLLVYHNDSSSGDYRIRKTQSYIEDHFGKKLTVKKIAKMYNLNPHYFGVLFKNETGVTFNRYLMHIRCKKAQNMLASGEYRVEDVSESCGFTDTAHLNKCFKAVLGFPPSRFLPKENFLA